MSGKQAKRLRRMEKDVESIRDGLKEATYGAYEQEVRLSDAESGLKDQDARLKKLEGGLDSFQRYLLETKDDALMKAQENCRAAIRKTIDAEQAVKIWKAVCVGTIVAATLTVLMAAMAINARGESVQPEQVPPPEPPAVIHTIQSVQTIQNAPATSEENENERIEAALLARAHKLENVRVTYYDTCTECCGKSDGITASGVTAVPYVTCAVDPAVIPLGSDVLVDYGDGVLRYLRADDTGAGVTGDRIDICVSSHAEALWLGVDKADVYWVEG